MGLSGVSMVDRGLHEAAWDVMETGMNWRGAA